MVKPVKNAAQFSDQWANLGNELDKAVGNEKLQKKVLKAALKIVKEEAKHDPFDAYAKFEALKGKFPGAENRQKCALVDSSKDAWQASQIITQSQEIRHERIKELVEDVAKVLSIRSEDEPTLFFALTARELLAVTDDPDLQKKAPKILEKIAEIEHLSSYYKIDEADMNKLFDKYKSKMIDVNKSVGEKLTLEEVASKREVILTHIEKSEPAKKAPILAFLRLCEMRAQEENLTKLGLTSADIDRYPVDTPYLGRNGVEPVIGFRRRATIVMQNIRSIILPNYAAKGKDGQVQQSYKNALKFCDDHDYDISIEKTADLSSKPKKLGKKVARQYGGDNPADLQSDLARTLATAKKFENTEINWTTGDSVKNVKELGVDGVNDCGNKDRHGGSWDVAKGSQEESLFRQSNLSAALKKTVDKLRGRRQNHIPAAGVIVNPSVTFMDPNDPNNTIECDVVSIAAVDYRKHHTRQHSEIEKAAKKADVEPKDFMKQATKNKYAAMFGAFLENGNTKLLISLPGLGAFKNDPGMVMEILKELLINDDAPFKNMFESVTFNVYDDKDKTVGYLEGIGIEKLKRQAL